MKNLQLFSRRENAPVDFRPDPAPQSPASQLRRLEVYLSKDLPPAADITDCPDALNAFREFTYRKTFTGCTHEQFIETDTHHPEAIDWLLAVAELANTAYKPKTALPRR